MNPQPDTGPAERSLEENLVWWRDESRSTEVPRRHVFGWAIADASRFGVCVIDSEHLRLSRDQVETHLAAQLSVDLGLDIADVKLRPAYEGWSDLDPGVRIVAAGHRLVTFDLQHHYSQDCRAGVTAELRGQGIAARVVLDASLMQSERFESLAWAEQQLSAFRALDSAHLHERGWTETVPGRWQILTYTTDLQTIRDDAQDIRPSAVPPSPTSLEQPILGQ